MGERLRYTIDIPDELRAQPFPPMMVLTLVENAVKHGLNPSPDGGTLAIRARRQDRNLMLSIADTGVGFAVAATGGSGVGLANTRARLAALHARSLAAEAETAAGNVADKRELHAFVSTDVAEINGGTMELASRKEIGRASCRERV